MVWPSDQQLLPRGQLIWVYAVYLDCSRQVKATTYTTVVHPDLEYASPVWDLLNYYKQLYERLIVAVQEESNL